MSKPGHKSELLLLLLEYHRGHLATSIDVSPGDAGTGIAVEVVPARAHQAVLTGVTSLLRAAFLPEGFPESVSPDYLGFQTWDTLQALSSYVRGVLTSQAILRGVGVGQQASTPLAAVFTFFVRDLAGMLGAILFAYLEGSSFDACAKQWRLFADITNDMGMTVELASPFFPRAMFLPIACLGSIARSLTGVAGGATRAALTQHFAQRGNAADVSAKEQSQETATTILGMVAGMLVTRLLAEGEAGTDPSGTSSASSSSSAVWAWSVFLALTALHVVANVAAMRGLLLRSINTPRLELLVDRYLRDGQVLGPGAVSKLEDLTPPPFRRLMDLVTGASWRRRVQLQYGTRLASALQAAAAAAAGTGGASGGGAHRQLQKRIVKRLLHRQGVRPYLLMATSTPTTHTSPSGGSPALGRVSVHLVLRRGATASDSLRAFVHAHCLAHFCKLSSQGAALPQPHPHHQEKVAVGAGSRTAAAAAADEGPLGAAERAADEWMMARYDSFVSDLQAAGWHTDRVALPQPSWRGEWGVAVEETDDVGGAGGPKVAGPRPHED